VAQQAAIALQLVAALGQQALRAVLQVKQEEAAQAAKVVPAAKVVRAARVVRAAHAHSYRLANRPRLMHGSLNPANDFPSVLIGRHASKRALRC
jgi:hypothetical protein